VLLFLTSSDEDKPGLGKVKLRQLRADDLRMVRAFLFTANRGHLHIDWIDPLSYLERGEAFLLFEDENLQAVGIIPEDPVGVRWCRAFYFNPNSEGSDLWMVFWKFFLNQYSIPSIPTCVMDPNFEFAGRLLELGFMKTSEVVYLRRKISTLNFGHQPDPQIFPLTSDEVDQVWQIDQQCFDPIWRFPHESIEKGLRVSGISTKIIKSGEMVGYQISNYNYDHLHLARLAVIPEFRRKGYARQLVIDLFMRAIEHYISDISVNTQTDNHASLELYRDLGFEMGNQKIAIYCYQ